MTSALDRFQAKLARADELIVQFDAEMRSFLTAEPRPYKIVGAHRNGDTEFAFVASGLDVPLRFSVLAGEVVHHLRSVLDHVVWALVEKNLGNPSRKTQFPICDTKAGYEKSLKDGIVKGVGNQALEIIGSVQPFKQPTPCDTVLFAIHEMDIVDKHRLLVVVGSVAKLGDSIDRRRTGHVRAQIKAASNRRI